MLESLNEVLFKNMYLEEKNEITATIKRQRNKTR
jgi:hypothetical protein